MMPPNTNGPTSTITPTKPPFVSPNAAVNGLSTMGVPVVGVRVGLLVPKATERLFKLEARFDLTIRSAGRTVGRDVQGESSRNFSAIARASGEALALLCAPARMVPAVGRWPGRGGAASVESSLRPSQFSGPCLSSRKFPSHCRTAVCKHPAAANRSLSLPKVG
jgi:hypothetical protein